MTNKLTNKQKLFCKEYLVDLNATQAAIRAGYSEKTAQQIGSQNLLKLVIQEHIAEAQKERAEKMEINAEFVLNGIREVINDAKTLKHDSEGNQSMTDRSGALKGFELLGKHIKLFTEKTEITGANGEALMPSSIKIELVSADKTTDS